MNLPDYKWIDVAIGGVDKRNNIVDITKFRVPIGQVDCYRTVYRYPQAFKEHVDKTGSVAGYRGPVYADFFPLDIDDDELEKAHETARRVLDNLFINYEVDLDQLRYYFSGAKGFHIMIPAQIIGLYASPRLPQAFKKMAAQFGAKVDPKIYDTVRLFRLSNTINSKTRLYKIPLTPAEILHLETKQIIELAKQPREIETVKEYTLNPILQNLFNDAMKEELLPEPARTEVRPPKDAKLCYYEILKGVGEGNRDDSALRLAVHLVKQYPPDMVYNMMLAWNKRNHPPLDDRDIEKAVKQAADKPYDFGCKDPVLQSFCQPGCHLRRQKDESRVTAAKIYNMADAENKYREYIKNLQKRKMSLGVSLLDKAMRGIAPGEVCEVLARAGVGKTAFLLNVIKHIGENHDAPVLFFSLEQPLAQIYERATQISVGATGWEIEEHYKKEAGTRAFSTIVKASYGHLWVVDEDFLTYEELRDFITIAEQEKIGRKAGLVCIDYLGRMKGGYGSQYEVTSELAKLIKRLAKETDTAILYLHQTNRTGKTGEEQVTMDMARDSGVVEEAADFVIGMWRPDINKPEAQKAEVEELKLALLKNRKGPLCQLGVRFNKKYLRIEEGGK